MNDKGQDIPATIFDKVTYELHPSFGKRAKQSMFAINMAYCCTEANAIDPQQRKSLHLNFQRKDGENSR